MSRSQFTTASHRAAQEVFQSPRSHGAVRIHRTASFPETQHSQSTHTLDKAHSLPEMDHPLTATDNAFKLGNIAPSQEVFKPPPEKKKRIRKPKQPKLEKTTGTFVRIMIMPQWRTLMGEQ